jgi:hypothetical protein
MDDEKEPIRTYHERIVRAIGRRDPDFAGRERFAAADVQVGCRADAGWMPGGCRVDAGVNAARREKMAGRPRTVRARRDRRSANFCIRPRRPLGALQILQRA